ncbi:hypothetical protein QTH91_10620 [Variovorax dokdonensis]|uniref:Zinc finger/thioredoxin putative domain-containing protein n=1 Tax=Variovorax dokdonensis TaxID=344883 RepID=A0ABT7NAH5_9BURK|nr:hypothetical protein [Variovorax dokdonensis]MDM0044939.1 hypothetical protein [Variovorax dokdonensis]
MDEQTVIARLGFRKWYERELLFSHVQLVLLVLSLVGLLGALELAGDRHGMARLTPLVCALASGAVGLWALRRYLWRLAHAQQVAAQAVCTACQAWARWDVERESVPAADEAPRMRVRCRGCANVWDIAL